MPFERLVEVLDPVRSAARTPLFQVMLSFENIGPARFELPDLVLSALDTDVHTARFDLEVTLSELPDDGGFGGTITYAADLFDETTAASIATRFTRLLSTLATDPRVAVGDVDVLEPAERERLLGYGSGIAVPSTGETVPDLLAARAQMSPGAVAVSDEQDTLDRAEFERRVSRLARRLISSGVGPEVRVAVAMDRSLDMVVSIVAVLVAGGAYVPIDPEQPVDRIAYVLDVADPQVVLSRSDRRIATERTTIVVDTDASSEFDDRPLSADERLGVLRPDNAAYVLFTSGSTGRPKGVTVSHGAVVNQLRWMQSRFELNASDSVLLKTPVTFDASVWELLLPLVTGSRMVIASADGHRDPAYLARMLTESGVTVAQFVPTVLDAVLDEIDGASPSSVRLVFAGGEALAASTAERVRTVLGAEVHNLYGPTEVTVQATHRSADAWTVCTCRSAVRCGTPRRWCWTGVCGRFRSVWSVSCICPASRWRVDMPVVRDCRRSVSWRIRSAGRGSGCIARVTSFDGRAMESSSMWVVTICR